MDGRKPLNPIFNNNHKKKEDPLLIRNVRKIPITKDEGRKTRIDKKRMLRFLFQMKKENSLKDWQIGEDYNQHLFVHS